MYAETPRKLLLVGSLGAFEVRSLATYFAQLHRNGETELLVNLDGVGDCDLAGLQGLLAFSDHAGLAVSVEGAQWAQFRKLLSRVPAEDVQRLCDDVRSLVGSTLAPQVEG